LPTREVAYNWWATEDELIALSRVPAEVLRRGVESGLFDGLAREVDGAFQYAPDVAPLVAWSDKLGDDVMAGRLTGAQAKVLLWRRARQLRRRTETLDRTLTQWRG
jgi:hypothetical protein